MTVKNDPEVNNFLSVTFQKHVVTGITMLVCRKEFKLYNEFYLIEIGQHLAEVMTKIEEYSAKRGSSPIWFREKMAKQDVVYHCCKWPAVTLKWLLHMIWISHHYETFTECWNEDSVAEIDTNSIFMICGLDPLLALYSSIKLGPFTSHH